MAFAQLGSENSLQMCGKDGIVESTTSILVKELFNN
jgi:hypothetical protein